MEMGKASVQKLYGKTFELIKAVARFSFNMKFPPVDEAFEDKIYAATHSGCFLGGIRTNM